MAVVLFEMLTGKPYFEAEISQKLEWMIRNYRALQPSIAQLPGGLREILSRALDPDLSHRFASAAAFRAALFEWRKFASAGPAEVAADLNATRRTAFSNPDEKTRRATIPPGVKPGVVKPGVVKPAPRPPAQVARGLMPGLVALFLIAVFVIVYEGRMLNNADTLANQIDSGRISLADALPAYQSLSKHSLFSLPLYPARRSLRNRYTAEADRVIADYREASDSTPVTTRDWKRCPGEALLAAAMSISPNDNKLRGKYSLINGFLALKSNLRESRNDFEESARLLPDSPDPHLGLALYQMSQNNLDQAEEELRKAERNGFQSGPQGNKGAWPMDTASEANDGSPKPTAPGASRRCRTL